MSFKKPFRAVPIRQGAHYAAQRRKHRRGRFLTRMLAGTLICGAVGVGSVFLGGDSNRAADREYTDQAGAAETVPYMPQHALSAAELDAQQPSSGGAVVAPARRARAMASDWSYRNCREARAAGAAPLYTGQPGYGAHMDGDGDGIACEPYVGPR